MAEQERGSTLSRDGLAGGRSRTSRRETAGPTRSLDWQQPHACSSRAARDPEDGWVAPA